MAHKESNSRVRIKPLNTQYDKDLERFYADRKKYKFIQAKPENESFAVIIKCKQVGSKKLLDDAYALKMESINGSN